MISRVLVPTAPDAPNRSIASYAIEIAEPFDASITVFTALDRPQQRDQIRTDPEDEAREETEPILEMIREAGLQGERKVRDGEAAEEILGAIEDHDIDLVVMGTHGRSGAERMLLGSVAEEVIRESPVPILTVTPDAAATANMPSSEGRPPS